MPEPLLRHFNYLHLPEPARPVSERFHVLAHWLVDRVPAGEERRVALRKLLESKDAAVRAALFPEGVTDGEKTDQATGR